ncbi:MAG TPA: hypothetical protein VE826_02055, partial [Dongiaceae bacterium]|nr:hypothetical protein [Dongiaceae bacterium]
IPKQLDDPELDAVVRSITPLMFLEAALAENRRVMARLDGRLLKPTVMPVLANLLAAGIRMLPPRPTAAGSARFSANGASAVAVASAEIAS